METVHFVICLELYGVSGSDLIQCSLPSAYVHVFFFFCLFVVMVHLVGSCQNKEASVHVEMPAPQTMYGQLFLHFPSRAVLEALWLYVVCMHHLEVVTSAPCQVRALAVSAHMCACVMGTGIAGCFVRPSRVAKLNGKSVVWFCQQRVQKLHWQSVLSYVVVVA